MAALLTVAAVLVGAAVVTAALTLGPPRPVVRALATDPAAAAPPGQRFTLAELHAGAVDPARFDALWAAEVAAIEAAPCAPPAPAAGTVVVFAAGATPPAHLRGRYTDWAPRISAARERHAARCTAPSAGSATDQVSDASRR